MYKKYDSKEITTKNSKLQIFFNFPMHESNMMK